MKSTAKLGAAALLVGIILGGSVPPAFAQSQNGASGTWGTAPFVYTNWATIDNSAKAARTNIKLNSGTYISTGLVKANARLYRWDTNALCTASGYVTSSGFYFTYTVSTNTSYCGYINHYSLGLTQAWNGSSYTTYATYIAGPLVF